MGKALIKSTSTSTGGTTGVTTTVASTGATGSTPQGITNPPGQVVSGTLEDVQSGAVINYSQAFGAELGIAVGVKVNYQTVTIGGQTVANVVTLAHRGEVTSINSTNDGGTLTDKATKASIPFAQVGVAESGIVAGTKVNFEKIVNPLTGAVTAVALNVIGE